MMSSTEVIQLTKECLQALRLGSKGETNSGNEKLEVTSDVKESLKILNSERENSPEDDKHQSENTRHILSTLKALLEFLPMRGAPKEAYGSKGGKIIKHEIQCSQLMLLERKEFCRKGYLAVLNLLVNSFDEPWFESLNKKQRKRFIDPFFLEGIPSYVLLVFCDRLKNLPQGICLSRLMAMLEKFFTSDNYRNIFFQHAFNHHPAIDSDILQAVTDKILTALTSFPEIASNKLKEQTPKYLSLKSYYTFVVLQLTLSISEIMLEKEYSQKPLPPTVPVFFGAVLGKLCLSSGGYGDQILVQLLSSNGVTCLDHQDWKDLFNNIFVNVPDTCLEATLLPLLRHCAHPIGVQCILGDDFLSKKTKAIFLLTNKFLFVRHFSNHIILQNVMGYLSSTTSENHGLRQKVFISTIAKLLEVWGSENSLKHTSVDQHKYLTKAILCSMAHLSPEDIRQHGDVFLSRLLTGMSCHLASPVLMVRELGMVLAEITVDILRTESQITRSETFGDKLEFEHASSEDVVELMSSLRNLSKAPELPTMKIGERVVPTSIFPKWDSNSGSCITNIPTKIGELSSSELAEAVNKLEITDDLLPSSAKDERTVNTEELDSDDDLEPYDMSHDSTYNRLADRKAPRYLQECMEGLLNSSQESKDPGANSEKLEVCLKNCEVLIRNAQTETVNEVGIDMARILLHLADQFRADNYNFEELRLNALIACLVKAPKKVATYLTGEFYERNYSIRQRMDILEVLSNGAMELANPAMSSNGIQKSPNLWVSPDQNKPPALQNGKSSQNGNDPEDHCVEKEPEHWSTVVQKRIDSKTKIISKGKTKPELELVPNRFGPVAGNFFFPLLKMLDRPRATLDLLDKDYLLLGRLLYTLGVLLYSAINTPICRSMAGSLLEVVWCIRYNSQTYVRLSLIYAISIVAITVPPHILVSDFQTELLDTKAWLEDVVTKDPEPECQRQANQTLSLLVAALAQGVPQISA